LEFVAGARGFVFEAASRAVMVAISSTPRMSKGWFGAGPGVNFGGGVGGRTHEFRPSGVRRGWADQPGARRRGSMLNVWPGFAQFSRRPPSGRRAFPCGGLRREGFDCLTGRCPRFRWGGKVSPRAAVGLRPPVRFARKAAGKSLAEPIRLGPRVGCGCAALGPVGMGGSTPKEGRAAARQAGGFFGPGPAPAGGAAPLGGGALPLGPEKGSPRFRGSSPVAGLWVEAARGPRSVMALGGTA